MVGSTSRTTSNSIRRRVRVDRRVGRLTNPLSSKKNVGHSAQPTPANPANGGEEDHSKVGPGSRLSIPG